MGERGRGGGGTRKEGRGKREEVRKFWRMEEGRNVEKMESEEWRMVERYRI